ncbi:MAG: GIY-YIG nuclease family protein [Planctomycetota bacterium]
MRGGSCYSSFPRKRESRGGGAGLTGSGRARTKTLYVYILASKRNGTLYIGVTSDLAKRVWEHREKLINGFTKEYGVDRLVWYEAHGTAESAIAREKRIKKWRRAWKIALIEKENPHWKDLYDEICV